MSNIAHFLHLHSEQRPAAVALMAPGRLPLSYDGLYKQVNRLAGRLQGFGIGRNDRVAIVLPNGPEMAVAFLAVAAVATAAPLNPAYRVQEFDFYLADLGAKALLALDAAGSPALEAAQERGVPVLRLTPCWHAAAGLFTLSGEAAPSSFLLSLAQPDDVALVLHTSGTTSRPKIVPLTHTNLSASAAHVGHTLALTPGDRCLNVMPLFHIHGLVAGLLATLAAGASVVCTPGFYAPSFFDWLAEFQPTWYTAVPTMHQLILARATKHSNVIADNRLRLIRSSSASLPPKVMQGLETTLNAPVIEAYGMTEAAHQMASNPLPPAIAKPGSVGLAAGPAVAIMHEQEERFMPLGEIGEIVIRGANVTPGYANNPAANQQAFTANGWFRTGDQGYLDADRYLFITGRLKEMINRGGEKIAPREVDEVLLQHPEVVQAVTFALPDERLGEAVAAAVVLRNKTRVTELELRRFAAARLVDFKVPQQVVIVDEIPKGPTGKLQRIGLAEALGLTHGAAGGAVCPVQLVAPRTELETLLIEIWLATLGLDQIGVDDHFLDLGGDSITATRLVARIRQSLQLELTLLDFFEAPTVAAQARLIEGLLAEETEPMR